MTFSLLSIVLYGGGGTNPMAQKPHAELPGSLLASQQVAFVLNYLWTCVAVLSPATTRTYSLNYLILIQ